MSKDKILELLAKLAAKEQSCRDLGQVHEAEAFAQKMNELLIRNNLTMSDVELAAREEDDEVGKSYIIPGEVRKRKRCAWAEHLAEIIAHAYQCRTLVITGSNRLVFVGRESSRELAVSTFKYLYQAVTSYVDVEWARLYYIHSARGTTDELRGWSQSFYDGFSFGLAKRFREQEEALKQEYGKEKWGLVVVKDSEVVNQFIEALKRGKADVLGGNNGYNHAGHIAGVRHARNVSINPEVSRGVCGTLHG